MSRTARLLLACLALPVVALIASALDAWRQASTATSWVLPIEGYDPRDPLRGHYLAFRYVLPDAAVANAWSDDWRLCFTGKAEQPSLSAVTMTDGDAGCAARARWIADHDGFRIEGAMSGHAVFTGRFYIPEADGQALTRLLAGRQVRMAMQVQVALNGKVTPIALLIEGKPYTDWLEDNQS